MRYLLVTKILFVVSSLLSVLLYQEVHRLSDSDSKTTLLKIPAKESSISLHTDKGVLGNFNLVAEQNSYYLEGVIEISTQDVITKAFTRANISFQDNNLLKTAFVELDTGNEKLALDIAISRTPNTELRLKTKAQSHERTLELPLKILRTIDVSGDHLIQAQQSSPLVQEVFKTLLKYVLDTQTMWLQKEGGGAVAQDHLKFDKLAAFVQGELFNIMNQKGIGGNG